MKNGHFEVGDMVMIGGYIPKRDTNYHKRGKVILVEGDRFYVKMIDNWSHPLEDGIVRHLSPSAWELVPGSFVGVSSLL